MQLIPAGCPVEEIDSPGRPHSAQIYSQRKVTDRPPWLPVRPSWSVDKCLLCTCVCSVAAVHRLPLLPLLRAHARTVPGRPGELGGYRWHGASCLLRVGMTSTHESSVISFVPHKPTPSSGFSSACARCFPDAHQGTMAFPPITHTWQIFVFMWVTRATALFSMQPLLCHHMK